MDVWYVDHGSLRLDIKIILITMLKVLKREGINPQRHISEMENGKRGIVFILA